MHEERLYLLAEKELAGQLQAGERAELDRILERSSESKAIYEEAKTILEAGSALFAGIDPDTDADWDSLRGMLENGAAEEAPVVPMRRKPYGWIGIAAAIAVLIGLGIWFVDFAGDEPPVEVVMSYEVENGKTLALVLSDQSQVVLNAGSKLDLADDFGQETRTVRLEGEAWFDIARDESKPFVIQTAGGTETRVLGTSFNVRAYPGQDVVEVDVGSGLVSFSSGISGKSMQLKADQGARCSIADGNMELRAPETVSKAEWRTGILVFKGTLLKDALVILEKHYDLEFEVAQEAQGEVLSATYDIRSIDEDMLLNNLRTTLAVNIERAGRRVTIRK